uniref:Zgc:103625 n=1 Tax=Oncorhynchus mykiss TaxID=8022 RepID=A0A8C7T3C9_ONCMY
MGLRLQHFILSMEPMGLWLQHFILSMEPMGLWLQHFILSMEPMGLWLQHFILSMEPMGSWLQHFILVRSYIAVTKVKTVLQPVHLDASEPWEKWAGLPRGACDVIVAINLLQCSSFDTVEGVVKGSGQILRQNGLLITHGPYAINGTITPSCMEDLDQELRQMNPGWGLPDIDILRQLAFGNGMRMERMIEREQDNKYLVYQDV